MLEINNASGEEDNGVVTRSPVNCGGCGARASDRRFMDALKLHPICSFQGARIVVLRL